MKPRIKKHPDNPEFWLCEGGGCWAMYRTIERAYKEWLAEWLVTSYLNSVSNYKT